MINRTKHCDDEGLRLLVSGDEDSDQFLLVAAHVATCDACQDRLETITSADAKATELRALLSSYPLDVNPVERGQHSDPSVAQRSPVVPLDFLGPPSHPEMLGRLGRYEIERVIGSGGMGVVLKGFDTELNRPVAIKMLAPHVARVGAARQRFAREARSAAAVVHEHVVAIHNVESKADVPFLVMQYIAGESLQVRVERDGPLAIREILRIGSQVAAGLAAAHEQGIVHRDVKPANILLEGGVERAYLTDFGLARVVDDASLTQTGVIAGTPHYMSPEQARGDASNHQSDLFSLGSVLYFMATAHAPFRAERTMAVLHRICRDRHRPLWQTRSDVPDELSILVDRLLEKRPARRLASADAVRRQLVALLGSVQEPRLGIARRIKRLAMRHRAAAFAVVATTAVALSASGWLASRPQAKLQRRIGNPTVVRPTNDAEDRMHSMSEQESLTFAQSVEELNIRLGALDKTSKFASGSAGADDWSEDVESIHQRLDRLQRTEGKMPSPSTVPPPHWGETQGGGTEVIFPSVQRRFLFESRSITGDEK